MENTILGKHYAPFSKDILQQQLLCIDRLWSIVWVPYKQLEAKTNPTSFLCGNRNGHHKAEVRTTDTNRTTQKTTQKAKDWITWTDIRPFLIALRYSLTFIYSCMFLCGNLFNLLFSMLCFVDHCLSRSSSFIICPSSIYDRDPGGSMS